MTRALEGASTFDFDRDVLPAEFRGLLEKERKVIQADRPEVGLVKEVIENVARQSS